MTSFSEQPMDVDGGDRPVPKLPKHAYPDGPRSLQSLYKWLAGAIKIYIIVELLIVLCWAYLLWLHLPWVNSAFTYEQQLQIDMTVGLISLPQSISMLAYAILLCRVSYRAMRNLHTISSKKAKMSPFWAAAWYFVPIANFWKPAEGMSQIYHGTYAAIGEKSATKSPIPLWWTLWLMGIFFSFLSGLWSGLSGYAAYEYSSTTFGFDIAASICSLLSAYALLRFLRHITDRQEAFKHGGVMTVFD